MHADALEWLWFVNSHAEVVYRLMYGDKDTFRLAFALAGKSDYFEQVQGAWILAKAKQSHGCMHEAHAPWIADPCEPRLTIRIWSQPWHHTKPLLCLCPDRYCSKSGASVFHASWVHDVRIVGNLSLIMSAGVPATQLPSGCF